MWVPGTRVEPKLGSLLTWLLLSELPGFMELSRAVVTARLSAACDVILRLEGALCVPGEEPRSARPTAAGYDAALSRIPAISALSMEGKWFIGCKWELTRSCEGRLGYATPLTPTVAAPCPARSSDTTADALFVESSRFAPNMGSS